MGRIALIVGGTGMAACELAPHLLDDFVGEEAFEKVAVLALGITEQTFAGKSKRPVLPLTGANLNERASIASALREHEMTGVTHVYWFLDANRPPKLANAVAMRRLLGVSDSLQSGVRPVLNAAPKAIKDKVFGTLAYLAGSGPQPRNIDWLTNMFWALEQVGAPLANFTMGTGGKHYGMHLGPSLMAGYATPFEEDKHKCDGPLSYFEMQDFLQAEAARLGFTWTVLRPTFIIGQCPEMTNTTQSFGLVFAVYASILKAQGRPLIFPGGVGSWNAKIQLSTSRKIAEVAAWASTGSASGLSRGGRGPYADPDREAVENQAFNVVSCGEFSWGEVWHELAQALKMPPGGAPKSSSGTLCLDVLGGEKEAIKVWKRIVEENGLQDLGFNQVFNADFLDKSFTATWDSQFSTRKLQAAGYPKDQVVEASSPVTLLLDLFSQLTREQIVPAFDAVSTGAPSPQQRSGRLSARLSAMFSKRQSLPMA